MTWTYHVVFGDGQETLAENGPHASSTQALIFATSMLRRTFADLCADPRTEARISDAEGAGRIVVGYTIERYDGEETDGDWCLNGGLTLGLRGTTTACG